MIEAAVGWQAGSETARAEQGELAPWPSLALLIAVIGLPAATAAIAILVLLGVIA